MKILRYWPQGIGLLLGIIVALVFITNTNDKDNIKKSYDGLVVTDKTGKAYMLCYANFSKFTVKEFDLEKMKLR
jgi:hypothetical protein